MTLEVREAMAEDLGPMLAWRGWSGAMRDAITSEFARLERDEAVMLLAFLAGEPVGTAQPVGTVQLVRDHADPDLIRDAAYLQALEVREGFRRRGIARALVAELERRASLEGRSRVTLMVEPDNETARAFYAALGYRAFKESTDTWDGQACAVLCLEKHLETPS